ncbi:MAG: TonB-dependent receptor domain-containing protein [Chitinophagales bacterium]
MLITQFLFAQTSSVEIRGKVTSSTGEKLDAAGVFLVDTKYNALTNSDGNYVIKNVSPGNYKLVCTYLGYKKFEEDIVVNDQKLQVNIVLEPDVQVLDQVVIIGQKEVNTVQRMPETEGTMIYAAKRNDVIQMDRQNSNTAQVVQREIFSKVPGVNLWEFDGSGNQISLGTRGLNPHRSIEMNVRQDGLVINSDLFGYPEAHYAPAMNGVDKIEIIRGSAALQYGPQFGGLLNYIMREGDPNKKFTYEAEQTAGSQQLISTFNSVGGTVGKWNYYSYFNYRSSTGYRPNGAYHNYTAYASVGYKFSDKLSAKFEYSFLDYVDQLSGGLNDSMFNENPYQSNRSRNYFQPHFNIPALHLNLNLSENTSISFVSSYILGQRNSVMFIQPPTVADTINATTLQYSPRQVDRDWYYAWSNEARLLRKYSFLKHESALSIGVRYSDNKTHRAQRAAGTTGTDFDLSTTAPYLTDLHFTTINYAIFAENVFHIGKSFSLTPGIRLDILKTTSTGYVNYLPNDLIVDKTRDIPLAGCGAQYDISNQVNIYANISQAYRPVQYNDLIPLASLDQVDPNMKDSHGYQGDLGIRGSIKDILRFDAGLYYLYYADRIGTITLQDSAGTNYNYKTNTGTSEAKGLEAFFEFHPLNLAGIHTAGDISIFTSTSTDHAVYMKGSTIVVSGENKDISGNRLENAPDFITRTGITYSYERVSVTFQYSYTSETFSDAANTKFSSTGISGIVPAYGLFDLNAVVDLGKFNLKGGINNLTDEKYFTRRINTYPGPGILPGDGRTFYLSFGVKI